MDVVATERMETFAKEVLKLSPEMRDVFFDELENNGIATAEEVEGLKKYVSLYRMFTNQRYYNAVKQCVTEMYMSEMSR